MTHRSVKPAGHTLGVRGERAAETFLLRAGLRLLARGFRCRAGEIDLVLRDGDTLVFVEVKTRRPSRFGRPADAVDRRKRRKLVRAASFYLAGLRGRLPPCRFDVVEVVSDVDDGLSVRHIPDAFRLDDRTGGTRCERSRRRS
jgi:putative endonuclease